MKKASSREVAGLAQALDLVEDGIPHLEEL